MLVNARVCSAQNGLHSSVLYERAETTPDMRQEEGTAFSPDPNYQHIWRDLKGWAQTIRNHMIKLWIFRVFV